METAALTLDPTKIRPRAGWCIVLAEPRRAMAGLLYMPANETGVEKVTEGAGRVIRVGAGEKNQKMGLEEGQRILYRGFLKHANPIPTEEKWPDGQAKQYFIMSSDDILSIIPDGIDIGAFSQPKK
jgi:co-chaperonin GroES (HSP10)